jgi:hypothetical protein
MPEAPERLPDVRRTDRGRAHQQVRQHDREQHGHHTQPS